MRTIDDFGPLAAAIHAEGLRPPELNGFHAGDIWCLDETAGGWSVYYRGERGEIESEVRTFTDRSAAIDALIEGLRELKASHELSQVWARESQRAAEAQLREDCSHNWSQAEAEQIIADESLNVNFLVDAPVPERFSLLADADGWVAGYLRADEQFDPRSRRRFTNEREAISYSIVRARRNRRSVLNEAARERGEI